jgi:hypothetical protein
MTGTYGVPSQRQVCRMETHGHYGDLIQLDLTIGLRFSRVVP